MKITTIKLSTETKALLDEYKIHKRQSYDEVLWNILKSKIENNDELCCDMSEKFANEEKSE